MSGRADAPGRGVQCGCDLSRLLRGLCVGQAASIRLNEGCLGRVTLCTCVGIIDQPHRTTPWCYRGPATGLAGGGMDKRLLHPFHVQPFASPLPQGRTKPGPARGSLGAKRVRAFFRRPIARCVHKVRSGRPCSRVGQTAWRRKRPSGTAMPFRYRDVVVRWRSADRTVRRHSRTNGCA